MFGHSERADDFSFTFVGIRPVYIGDNLCQRLRGGCGFAFRGGKGT
jgi:hypothetical protein